MLTSYAQSVDKYGVKKSYSQGGALLTIPKDDRFCNVFVVLSRYYSRCR